MTGTVYVSFLGYGKPDMKAAHTDVVVAKSTDFGKTWTATKVNGPLCTVCDHPWTAAYNNNVYVMYASGPNHYLSRSSDGGATWTENVVLQDTHVAFPEGSVVDAGGNAWFAWATASEAAPARTRRSTASR